MSDSAGTGNGGGGLLLCVPGVRYPSFLFSRECASFLLFVLFPVQHTFGTFHTLFMPTGMAEEASMILLE